MHARVARAENPPVDDLHPGARALHLEAARCDPASRRAIYVDMGQVLARTRGTSALQLETVLYPSASKMYQACSSAIPDV
jgi:hypothetical protein